MPRTSSGSGLPGGNEYSFQTYTAPAGKRLQSVEPTVSVVTPSFINTLATDGKSAITTSGGNSVGSGVYWAGNGIETVVRCADGTLFARYPSASGDKLIKSPNGGGGANSVWTTLLTTTGTMDYSIILYDPSAGVVIYFVPTGSSHNWTMQVYVLKSDGTQLLHTVIPQTTTFLQGISTNSYYRAGIGANGQWVIFQPLAYWPAQSMQRTQTKGLATLILSGKYSATGNSMTLDEPHVFYDDERWAYHTPVVGLNGDPDFICWLCGRDVQNSEDTDPVTGLPGTDTGFYDFDQIGYGWYNRRSRQSSHGIKRLTQRLGFLNSPCYVYATWSANATSITINEIISGTIRFGQVPTVADSSGATFGAATVFLGTSTGAVGAAVPLVTTYGGSTAIAPSGGVAGTRVKLKLVENTGTVSTPQKRFYTITVGNDGYIYAAYINSRQVGSSSSTLSAGHAGNSYRLLKVSAMGDVVYDQELFSEGSTLGQQYHTTYQSNYTNQLYLVRSVGNSTAGCTEFHFLRIMENQTCSFSNVTPSNGTTTVTIGAGTNVGILYVGMQLNGHSGIPIDSYITKWGTYNPTTGTGTVSINNVCTNSTAGSVTGWARVCVEDRLPENSLNSMWGTNSNYTPNAGSSTITANTPARAMGFIPFIPDNRSGSVETTNGVDMLIFRRDTGYPTPSSSGYADVLEHMHAVLPY